VFESLSAAPIDQAQTPRDRSVGSAILPGTDSRTTGNSRTTRASGAAARAVAASTRLPSVHGRRDSHGDPHGDPRHLWPSSRLAGTVEADEPHLEVILKPDLTLSRAMRHLLTWWWVVALCAVLVPALTVSLAGNGLTSATAKVRVHEVDTSVAYLSSGEPQPYTGSRSVNELTKSDFVDPQIAAKAAAKLGGAVTGQDLVNGLGFTPLNGTDVEFSYSGGSTSAIAAQRLGAYVDSLVSERRAAQRGPLIAAAQKLRTSGGSSSAAQRLQAAADSLDQQIYQVGQITSSKSRTIPQSAVIAGSLVAGIILGTMVALALGALDPRVRRLADLRSAGLRATEVDSSDRSSVETLRAIVEVAGVGPDGGVIAVTTVGRNETPVAHALATAFADTGRPTTLLTDRGAARSQDGDWTPTAGEGQVLQTTTRLRDALSAGRPGEVTVIDAPGLEQRPHALIASAVSDVTLLCLQRGTTWGQLQTSLELLEDSVVAGRVRVTLERGGLLTRRRSSMLGRASKPGRARVGSYS
jgi:hypothetical protein